MSLELSAFKESHQTFDWLEHEAIIVINAVNLSLLIFYHYYEILAWIFSRFFSYPQLPTEIYTKYTIRYEGTRATILMIIVKLSFFLSSFWGLLGCASWKLRYTTLSLIISFFPSGQDIYLLIRGRFHDIDPDNFLLFQNLFSTVIRTVRTFSTVANMMFFFHFIFRSPPSLADIL